LILCAASSSLYIINDLRDIEKDKLHPFKKHRPLPSGNLSKNFALTTAAILSLTALYGASTISTSFLFLLLTFYGLQLSYTFFLKNVILLDILAIAGTFILRVFAGEIATGYHINIWLFLTVISLSLFLAIGKRRSELTLLSGWSGSIPVKTRETLSRYSEKMLDVYISMFANSSWITYALYTFLQRPPVIRQPLVKFLNQYQLDILQERKLMTLTIPIAIYGIMRYLQLVYEKNEGESPEKVLFSDPPLMITCLLMTIMLFTIIYLIGT